MEACAAAGAGAGLLAGAAAGRAGRLGPPPLPPPVVRVTTRRKLSSLLWTRRRRCRRSVETDLGEVAHQTDCEGVLLQQRVLSCEPSSPQVSTFSHHLRLPGEPAGWGRCRWGEEPPWGSAPQPLPHWTKWSRHWRRRSAPGAAAARASLTSRWLHCSMPAHQDGHVMERTFFAKVLRKDAAGGTVRPAAQSTHTDDRTAPPHLEGGAAGRVPSHQGQRPAAAPAAPAGWAWRSAARGRALLRPQVPLVLLEPLTAAALAAAAPGRAARGRARRCRRAPPPPPQACEYNEHQRVICTASNGAGWTPLSSC